MSREQLALRILSADAEIDSHRLRLGSSHRSRRATDHRLHWSAFGVAGVRRRYALSRQWLKCGARPVGSLWSTALDLLIVDYLQLIQGRGRGDNRVQEISEISRSIKGMARDLRIPVITCSQLSRLVENRPGHRPHALRPARQWQHRTRLRCSHVHSPGRHLLHRRRLGAALPRDGPTPRTSPK